METIGTEYFFDLLKNNTLGSPGPVTFFHKSQVIPHYSGSVLVTQVLL